MRIQHTALPETPWSREADGNAISCRSLERIQLLTPINQKLGGDWPLVVERIHRTGWYSYLVPLGTRYSSN